MDKGKICYALRAKRRSLGLSQKELATLLGLQSAAQVSRIEQGLRDPSFATAFACAALFKSPLCELFPHVTAEAKERLKARTALTCSLLTRPADPAHDRLLHRSVYFSHHEEMY